METKTKCEELKYIISRYDHYYDSINNKGNVFLTLNTFILGGLIASCYAIKPDGGFTNSVVFLLVITILLCLASSFYTLRAIKPHLAAKDKNRVKSVIFFNDVADHSIKDYGKKWQNLKYDAFYDDLTKQVYNLAEGLTSKFYCLNRATYFIAAQILVAIVLYITIYLTI